MTRFDVAAAAPACGSAGRIAFRAGGCETLEQAPARRAATSARSARAFKAMAAVVRWRRSAPFLVVADAARLLQIVLMVFLGAIERTCMKDIGYDSTDE